MFKPDGGHPIIGGGTGPFVDGNPGFRGPVTPVGVNTYAP